MSEEKKRPLVALCEALDAAFAEDPRGGAVPGLLESYTSAHSDWETYRHFVDGGYTHLDRKATS